MEYNGVINIWNGITGFFSSIWSGIKNTVGQIGTVLSGAFKDAFNAIIDLWDDTMGKIFHGQTLSVGPVHLSMPNLNIPKMADGGIVDSATLALIGEAGPEAVVPLNKSGSAMGNTYNIQNVLLSTADAVDEFFSIGNRNTALELNGGSPLAGTSGV
jgi:phage-related protein